MLLIYKFKTIFTDCVPLAFGLPRPFFSTAVDPSSDILINLLKPTKANPETILIVI